MDLSKIINNLTDWAKFSPRILLAFTIICGAFLFGDSDIFITLGLEYIQAQFRPYFGIGFLFFGSLLISFPISEGIKFLYKKLKTKVEQQQRRKIVKDWLLQLTPSQKEILRKFIINDTRSYSLNYEDGSVTELMNAGIIYLPTSISIFKRFPRQGNGLYTDFNIQPWVFKYLKDHLELIN